MSTIKRKIVSVLTTATVSVMMIAPVGSVGAEMTVEQLQEQIAALQKQLASLTAQLSSLEGEGTPSPTVSGEAPAACEGITFSRNLKAGMSGDDVKCLQAVLNTDPETQVAASGVGSTGNETTYFGSLTKGAVIKFQQRYADDVLASWGLTQGTGFVGSTTRAKLNEILDELRAQGEEGEEGEEVEEGEEGEEGEEAEEEEEGEEEPVAEGLTVALAAEIPAAGTIIISGSSATEFSKVTFTNGDSSDVTVTSLIVKRGGISDDTTVSNLYLFDGYKRLGDEATLSSGYARFNKASGLFTVPAGGSKTISLRADVASGISGQTVALAIEDADDITSDASVVNGTFPISGNTLSIANPSSAATVNFTSVGPSGGGIDATTDYVLWQGNMTVTNQNVELEYVRFSQIGSAVASALDNLRLYIGGNEVATGELVTADVGQEVDFDLSGSPLSITKGQTKAVKVYGDIVDGADKSIRFSVEKTADIFVKDASYGHYALATEDGDSNFPMRGGILEVNSGSVVVTRSSDNPTGAVVLATANQSLAKYDIKAMGEDIKINSLRLAGVITGTTSVKFLRNVSLYLDGVQVGNTANLNTTDASTDYLDFNIYQTLSAGKTKTLEVKGDIYGCAKNTCSGDNLLSSGDTIKIRVVGNTSLDNAQGLASLNLIDAPGSKSDAVARTVGTGSLTVKKSTSYGDQSVAAGSDTKLGQYTLTTSAYDDVNISSLTLAVNVTTMTRSELSNLYLKYGDETTAAKGSVGSSNIFSVNTSLSAGESMTVEVWATIDTSTSADDAASTTLDVSATRATDGAVAYSDGAKTGQTITIKAGVLAAAAASDMPVSAVLVGKAQDQLLAKYTFSALYEAFTVDRLDIQTPAGTTDDYTGVYLKYTDSDGVEIQTSALDLSTNPRQFAGQTFYVPANDSANLEVYGNMNAVGSGYADSGDQPKITLDYYKASSGSQANVTSTDDIAGNAMLLYKTAPTVAISGSTSGTLTPGTVNLYKVNIAANAASDVALKQLTYDFSGNMASNSSTFSSFEFWRGTTDLTDSVAITSGGNSIESGGSSIAGNATATIKVVFSPEERITKGTSQNYYLKATLNALGSTTQAESVSVYLKDDASRIDPTTWASASSNNFVWSDRSAIGHATTTSDWTNGYLIDTLKTDTYTLTK